MNKRTRFVVLSLLSLGALAACGTNPSSESTSTSTPVPPSTSETDKPSVCPEPETHSFAVTTVAATGTEITLITTPDADGLFEAGSIVEFTALPTSEQYEITEVKVGDTTLVPQASYSFVMPNHDIEIATTAKVLGGNDVATVTAFTDETFAALPADVASLNTLLKESKVVNGKLFKEGTFKQTVSGYSSYDDYYDVSIKACNNDVLYVDGFYSSLSDEFRAPYHQERGLQGDYYYEITDTGAEGNNNTRVKIQKTSTEEIPNPSDIALSDAELNVRFFDSFDFLDKSYFGNSSYDWTQGTVDKVLSEDKLSVTYHVSYMKAATSIYSDGAKLEVELTFDGDHFVTGFNATKETYAYASFTPEGALIEGATPSKVENLIYTATRGYKSTLPVSDLTQYVTNDYDLVTKSYVGSNSYYSTNGGETYVGSTLSFQFRNKEPNHTVVIPNLVGVAEGGEEFVKISGSTATVIGVGEFTLLFDNGLGQIKEFTFNAVLPLPQTLSVELSKTSAFTGEAVTLTATIAPTDAIQNVTVVAAEDSAACTITPGETGNVYQVTGTEIGKVKLIVTSTEDESVFREVSFDVVEKPSYESVYETITTKTLEGKDGWDKYYINFNTDGTGVFADEYGDYTCFTYTLDPETLAFTIADAEGGSGDAKLVSISAVDANNYQVTYEYWGKETTFAMTAVERVTLE